MLVSAWCLGVSDGGGGWGGGLLPLLPGYDWAFSPAAVLSTFGVDASGRSTKLADGTGDSVATVSVGRRATTSSSDVRVGIIGGGKRPSSCPGSHGGASSEAVVVVAGAGRGEDVREFARRHGKVTRLHLASFFDGREARKASRWRREGIGDGPAVFCQW